MWSDEDSNELDVELNPGSPTLSRSESQASPQPPDFSFGGFLQGAMQRRRGGARSPEQEENPEIAGISDSDEEGEDDE